MKIFLSLVLVLSWLLFAALGYVGYTYYMGLGPELTRTRVQVHELDGENFTLKQQVKSLQEQLATEKTKMAYTVSHLKDSIVTPAAEVLPPSATNFPSTIVTVVTGKTYEGCRLDRADPDGISIIHSKGVAKIPFSDLDPAFAASFGYNPGKGDQFAREEAARAAQSDQARDAYTAQRAAPVNQETAAKASPASPAAKASKTPEQIEAIQRQIQGLKQDVAFMQAQEAKLTQSGKVLKTNGAQMTGGAYAEKITQENAQISALEAQLK